MKTGSQTGNVLFLILIAVALFAALSYAVTQSGRGSGTIQREQAMLAAADAATYLISIRQAVTRLKLTGCDDTEITFEDSGYTGGANGPYAGNAEMLPAGANGNSPVDKSCHVFDRLGGGVLPRVLDKTAAATAPGTWARGGHIWFQMQALPGIGTAAGVDIIAIVPYVDSAVCMNWNRSFGVGGSTGARVAIPWAAGGAPYNFAGTFTSTMTGGGTGTYVSGTQAFCFCDDASDCNNFPASHQLAMVILER